jgi:hypothetical protein
MQMLLSVAKSFVPAGVLGIVPLSVEVMLDRVWQLSLVTVRIRRHVCILPNWSFGFWVQFGQLLASPPLFDDTQLSAFTRSKHLKSTA